MVEVAPSGDDGWSTTWLCRTWEDVTPRKYLALQNQLIKIATVLGIESKVSWEGGFRMKVIRRGCVAEVYQSSPAKDCGGGPQLLAIEYGPTPPAADPECETWDPNWTA